MINNTTKKNILNNKKVLLIYNPYSGKGKIRYMLNDILIKLSEAGYQIIVYPTQGPKDATRRIMEIDSTYSEIICSGGDGTLDEVVKGLVKGGINLPLGYIPSGTVNDFASTLGISSDIDSAINTAINGKEFKIDIGSFNGEYFTYVAAFGLFTSVAYSTDQDIKNALGKLAYFLEGTKQLSEIPSYRMKIEGDNFSLDGEYILGMITNSSSVGGVKTRLLDTTELNDGLFELTLVKAPKNINELSETIWALMNKEFNAEKSLIQSFKTSKISIQSDSDIAWTLDGENGGICKYAYIKNHKELITIRV